MTKEDCELKSQQINSALLKANSSISVRGLYTAIGNRINFKQNFFATQSAYPYYLLLLLVLIVAYLPLSTFYWGMKNDAFSVNFPNKLFFTQAVHCGFFPLWNPYLNFGLPLYADPGFAFWNPITWIFGAVPGYNAYSLTFEVLLYLYLAGFFMFRLCRFLLFDNPVSFLVACLFMCCGFFSSHIQHINFITCAPFIPLVLHRFLILQQHPSCRNAFFSSLAYYFIFASGHPAMPIAAIYFLLLLFLSLLASPDYRNKLPVLIAFHLLSIAFLVIEFLPAIYSYLHILPVYARAVPINIKDHLFTDSLDLTSIITFLFPFSSTAKTGFFVNDPSMRNCYFSIMGLICFWIGLTKKSPLIKSLFFTGVLLFAVSWGGELKLFLFSRLPGLAYIKTNGEFRVFGICCFCVIAAYGLQDLFDQKKRALFLAVSLLKVFVTISMVLLLGNLFYYRNDLPSIKFFATISGSPTSIIKNCIDHLPFSFCLFLSNIICILICLSFLLLRKWTPRRIIYITLADIIINTILILPVTTVGSTPLSQIQKIVDSCRKGIVIPALTPLNQLKEFDPVTTGLMGSYSYYDTNIGTREQTSYPSYFKFTASYFNSPFKDSLQSRPFIFSQKNNLNPGSPTSIVITRFSPQQMGFSVNSPVADTIVLLQNHYKYWHCSVNAKETAITTVYAGFMGVAVGAGVSSILFTYHDPLLLVCCLVSIVFVLSFLIGIYCFKKS